jgi:hypothetical protein
MQRRELVQSIADALFRAEDSADRSLRDASALIVTMTDARLDNRFSAVLGSDAMSATADAIKAFGEARDRLIVAHGALEKAAPALVGRDLVLTGPITGKPDPVVQPTGRLRAVA